MNWFTKNMWKPDPVAAPTPPVAPVGPPRIVSSYYPHWASRTGDITPAILDRLDKGTIIGVHHTMDKSDIKDILNHPKRFFISWYAECNINETDDAATGVPVVQRIAQAKVKQTSLVLSGFAHERFANLVELDAAREKEAGDLSGMGNQEEDWMKDADMVHAANFRYLAKSPTPGQVSKLRAAFGQDFVERIVYEDVTANPADEYRQNARALAKQGNIMTLIIHSGNYGGFQATSREAAIAIIRADFNLPNVEAYYGLPEGFQKLKSFS